MIRLLIVEDEKIVRETISTIIDWNANGIELIGACKDGLEAYDMILDEYPDIVITDIRMPGMDGLDLIQRTHRMDRDAKFVILSGYNDFEYAKTAMKSGVRHYLLKPCDEEQILEAVLSLEAEIRETQEKAAREQERTRTQFESVLKRQLTIEAITGSNEFPLLLERYGSVLEYANRPLFLYYFSFLEEDNLPDFIETVTPLRKIYHFEFILNVLYVKNTAVFVLAMDDTTNQTGFEQALDRLMPLENGSQLLWWKEDYPNISLLLSALSKRIHRYSRIVLVDNEHGYQEIYNYVATFQETDSTLAVLQDNPSETTVYHTVEELFADIADLELGRMLAIRLVGALSANGGDGKQTNHSKFLREIYQLDTLPEITRFTLQELLTTLQEEKQQSTKRYKGFVAEALDYVKNHVDDPRLSLKWLAENVLYMNVDYFGKQFVEQTGEKFSSYLNRIRMEKAKELILQEEYQPVYEIARQVGCGNNPQYFSQLFKKSTGCTPTQYREMR